MSVSVCENSCPEFILIKYDRKWTDVLQISILKGVASLLNLPVVILCCLSLRHPLRDGTEGPEQPMKPRQFTAAISVIRRLRETEQGNRMGQPGWLCENAQKPHPLFVCLGSWVMEEYC